MAEVSSMPALVHAVGGAIGSSMAMLLFYPLERARIDLQAKTANPDPIEATILTSEEEMAEEGEAMATVSAPQVAKNISLYRCLLDLYQRRELYQGAAPFTSTLALSNFIFFYIHTGMKRIFDNILLASYMAGVGNVLLTNPMWLVSIRLVSGEAKYPSMHQELIHVRKKYGLRYLWTGTGTALWLVSNPVIQFVVYEQLKLRYRKDWTALQAFVAGALSKMIATICTYPLQLTQNVLRLQKRNQTVQYQNVLDCLVKLYGKGGLPGLFVGMKAKLIQSALTTAFTFLTYEEILRCVHRVLQPKVLVSP